MPYNDDVYTSGFPSVTLNNFSTCQTSASITTGSQGYSGIWADRNYNVVVNGTNIGTFLGSQTIDISSYIPITSVQMNGLYSSWSWVDLTVNITSNNASMPATGPTVTNITYVQGDTASPLSATLNGTGTTLKWYTDQFGDNYSATAPTPSTTTVGTTSYYVSQANASGCESVRSVIVVTVVPNTPATHLNFDGVNDVVNLGTTTSSLLNNSNFLTVEAWIKVPNVVGTKTIVGNHVGWGGTQFNFRVINNTLNAFLGDGYYGVSSAAGTIVANTWTHVSMVYDDTTLKIYRNGVEVGSTSVPSGYSLANTSPQTFIGNSVFGGEIFEGNIDEVRIWNTVKTTEQLNGSKNCELQGTESGLIAYYKFNQGVDLANNSAVTTLNATTGPNGTLTNFALNGTTSNWLAGSPVTTGSIIPSVAAVTTPVVYNQGDTAAALTATTGTNGTGLMWYTTATGGTGSTTAPTPSTTTAGNTSYWVSSTNANGCESARTQIVVNVIVANDNCSNAINLSVGASSFNDFPVNVNLTTATNSGAPAPTCGNFQGGDVWYTVTVPASGNVVIETNGAGLYNTGLEVYSGNCGALSLVNCDDNSGNGDYSKILLLGQTPGTVLYVRVWENVFGISNAQFQVSAYDYVVPATHLNFDGVNDFVVSTNAVTNNTENQTYQAWFRIPSIPANSDRILQRGNDGTGGWSVQIDVNAAGKLSAGISASPDTFVTGTTVLTPNTWYHATFVFENNNSLRLYLNGNLEASVVIGNRTLRNSDNKLRIGSGNIASEYFNGDIDEVRVWNKVLNATDILSTMNCEIQASETGLVAYYKFNQGNDIINNASVTSLLDGSSNSNNGTLTNFALTGTTSNWKSGSTVTTGNTCATLGNTDFENIAKITVYPNPSTGVFNIVSQQDLVVEVYDLVGKLVLNQKIAIGTNSVDISNFSSGVYLLKAFDNSGNSESYKLIKQ
ncbi:hypothetical protein Q762_00790 [Flavobacterium cauense R2A-7]|nr:hypothetical protein Q762_00790 [Flavobacterium cauense R2A-7]